MTIAQLIAYIIANIGANGTQSITGLLLQQVLRYIANRLAQSFSANIPTGEYAIVHNLGDRAAHVTIWQLVAGKTVRVPEASYDCYVKEDSTKFTTVYVNSNIALPNCTIKISI